MQKINDFMQELNNSGNKYLIDLSYKNCFSVPCIAQYSEEINSLLAEKYPHESELWITIKNYTPYIKTKYTKFKEMSEYNGKLLLMVLYAKLELNY